ncbi:Fbd-associated f-box protein [Melia azedarach]|uniref:Fbd-associated f-box protein n=1 Tax=Melia azedarach TaxID=155640 RepID=A0ACC1XEC0_MELAZ|nr:Fbd-associated f-box protein [Melia azedarach]
MMKRPRLISANPYEKDVKQDENLGDLVGRLPDDILVNIISRLTLKEAARTSVLSSRWKYLWTFTSSLKFDPGRSILRYTLGMNPSEEERSKYINWVNKVLESHRGSINEFKVIFDLGDAHASSITNWIYTAISKRVQSLALYFIHLGPTYTFPQECCNILKNQCGIKSLRYLCFYGVNVTGEILEFFIYNCPLDGLYVVWSSTLSSLKVVGSSTQLKYLGINYCRNLKEVKISAPNLLFFDYTGPKIKLHVENVPQLFDVTIGGSDRVEPGQVISPIVSYFPQLKNLDLRFYADEVYKQFKNCGLPKLRHLTLQVLPCTHKRLFWLASILNKCPILEKLTLKLHSQFFVVGGRVIQHKICRFPLPNPQSSS